MNAQSLIEFAQAVPAVVKSLTVSLAPVYIVALHGGQLIKKYGGLKNIFKGLWDGDDEQKQTNETKAIESINPVPPPTLVMK